LPENPLLPHRKLRELYTLMLRCRDLDRKAHRIHPKHKHSAREAVLAATSLHLLPGDLLCAEPGDVTAAQLAPASKTPHATTPTVTPLFPRLPLCAALARGLQASGSDGLVLAYTTIGARASTNSAWPSALEWAQQANLPLLLTCIDPTSAAQSRPRTLHPKTGERPLDLASITPFARKLKLPVLLVDGEDAVAVYRVMQESAIRARSGGGPAVLWAVMTPTTPAKPRLPRSLQPLARLASYLAARKISLPR
jgi:TPP-dependent pyruvate/acetoin dehydrogenase alpha subunit